MAGKTGSKKTRRHAQQQPHPNRRDAMTQVIAAKDRRRKQRNYSGDTDRDLLTMGWLSQPVLERYPGRPTD
jgi:hypothetical protein